ncbi:MAG: GHKL domain-containing protein [Vallitaleaceae bacterium]|nr:GHKL domain-containing protein [Vallitaleaceae bacterium]
MFYIGLIFISFLQSVIGFTLMSSSVMNFKEPVKKRIAVGLLVMILGISVLSFILYTKGIDSVNRFAILFILVIELMWFLICAEDRFFVSLFSFLTFVNIYISISFISDNLSIGFGGNMYIIVRVLVRLGIYIVLIPLLFKSVRKRFRMLVDTLDKEWSPAVLVPLLFLIMQIMVLFYPEPYWKWNQSSWSLFVIVSLYFLFLAVYYLLYIQASTIVEKYALEKRQLLMAQQEKLWEAELTRQKATATLAFQQRHDMHHHNAVIMGLIQSNDLANLKQYIKSYDAELELARSKAFCKNPIANSILNVYANRAAEKGILTNFTISLPETIGIENIDLTCVLGNSLENALEGCLRLEEEDEKRIDVTLKYFDQRLRVKIENTCRQDIVFEKELPLTQKSGGGTGTKSILYTAERYDGTAGFSVVEGKFITQIVLNAKREE